MEFNFSDKANSFKPNIFNILNERKAKMIEKGHTVYDLFVGTPDFKPAQHVIDAVVEASKGCFKLQIFAWRYKGT